jgi:hypothetical protein
MIERWHEDNDIKIVKQPRKDGRISGWVDFKITVDNMRLKFLNNPDKIARWVDFKKL